MHNPDRDPRLTSSSREERLAAKQQRHNACVTAIRALVEKDDRAGLLSHQFLGLNALAFLMVGYPERETGVLDHTERRLIHNIRSAFRYPGSQHTGEWRKMVFGSKGDDSLSALQAAIAYDRQHEVVHMLRPVFEGNIQLTSYEAIQVARAYKSITDEELLSQFKNHLNDFIRVGLDQEELVFSPAIAEILGHLGRRDVSKIVYFGFQLLTIKNKLPGPSINLACEKIHKIAQKIFSEEEESVECADSWLKIILCELSVALMRENKYKALKALWQLQKSAGLFVGDQALFVTQICYADKFSLSDNARLVRDLAVSWPESFGEVIKSDSLFKAFASLLGTDQQGYMLRVVRAFPFEDSGLDRARILIKVGRFMSNTAAYNQDFVDAMVSAALDKCSDIFGQVPKSPEFYALKICLLSKTRLGASLLDFLMQLRSLPDQKQYQHALGCVPRSYINASQAISLGEGYTDVLRDLAKRESVENNIAGQTSGQDVWSKSFSTYRIHYFFNNFNEYFPWAGDAVIQLISPSAQLRSSEFRLGLITGFFKEYVAIKRWPRGAEGGQVYLSLLPGLLRDPVFGFGQEALWVRQIYLADKLKLKDRAILIVKIARQCPICFFLVMYSEILCPALNNVSGVSDQEVVLRVIKEMLSNYSDYEVFELDYLNLFFSSLIDFPSPFILRIVDAFLNEYIDEDLYSAGHYALRRLKERGFLGICGGWNDIFIYFLLKISQDESSSFAARRSDAYVTIFDTIALVCRTGTTDQFLQAVATLPMKDKVAWVKSCPELYQHWLSCVTINKSIRASLFQGVRNDAFLLKRRDSRPFVLMAAAKKKCKEFNSGELQGLTEVKRKMVEEVQVLLRLIEGAADGDALIAAIHSLKDYLIARNTDSAIWKEATSGAISHRCRDILELLVEACGLSKIIPISVTGKLMLVKYKPASVESEFKGIAEKDVIDAAIARMRSGMEDYNNDIMRFLRRRHPDKVEAVRAAISGGDQSQSGSLSGVSVLSQSNTSCGGGTGHSFTFKQ